MPLSVFTRRHCNVLEAGGIIRGGWRVVGASPGYPPKIAKIRLRIIRVLRINSVLYRMGRLRSPYDPSLIYCIRQDVKRQEVTRKSYTLTSQFLDCGSDLPSSGGRIYLLGK